MGAFLDFTDETGAHYTGRCADRDREAATTGRTRTRNALIALIGSEASVSHQRDYQQAFPQTWNRAQRFRWRTRAQPFSDDALQHQTSGRQAWRTTTIS
jgi:hypothetical protein